MQSANIVGDGRKFTSIKQEACSAVV